MSIVEQQREIIRNSIPNYEDREITKEFVQEMFEAIDKHILSGFVRHMLKETNSTISFDVSRKTKTAGTCSGKGCDYKITISKKLFSNLFNDGESSLLNNGLKCETRSDCMMLTMEHEMVHLILFMMKMTTEYHGRVFQCIVKELFGHTQYRHSMLHGDATDLLDRIDVIPYMVALTSKGEKGLVVKLNPKRVKIFIDGNLWNMPYSMLRKYKYSNDEQEKLMDEYEKYTKKNKKQSIDDQYTKKYNDMYAFTKDNVVVGDVLKTETGRIGVVVKVNPKKVIIDSQGDLWNVPYENLSSLSMMDNKPPEFVIRSAIKEFEKRDNPDKKGLKKGMRVKTSKGLGTIKRINPKTATVVLDDTSEWRISYSRLSKI